MINRENTKDEYALTENLKKSNYLIGAKYKCTALELKTTYLALRNIQDGKFEEKEGIVTSLTADEIAKAIGLKSKKNIYSQLKKIRGDMTNRIIGITNDEDNYFMSLAFINKAEYKNGVLTLRFPSELKSYLTNLGNGGFTLIPQKAFMSLKFSYSMKLYEVLKKECIYSDTCDELNKTYIFNIYKPLAELKFELGIINPQDDKIKHMFQETSVPDYEEAAELSKEKLYNIWSRFKLDILDKAMLEINNNQYSNIKFNFEGITNGKGRKIKGVEFIVVSLEKEDGTIIHRTKKEIAETLNLQEKDFYYPEENIEKDIIDVKYKDISNTNTKDKPVLSQEEMMDVMMDAMILFQQLPSGVHLSKDEIKFIVKEVNYDINKLQSAMQLLKNSDEEIVDITNWFIDTIHQ